VVEDEEDEEEDDGHHRWLRVEEHQESGIHQQLCLLSPLLLIPLGHEHRQLSPYERWERRRQLPARIFCHVEDLACRQSFPLALPNDIIQRVNLPRVARLHVALWREIAWALLPIRRRSQPTSSNVLLLLDLELRAQRPYAFPPLLLELVPLSLLVGRLDPLRTKSIDKRVPSLFLGHLPKASAPDALDAPLELHHVAKLARIRNDNLWRKVCWDRIRV